MHPPSNGGLYIFTFILLFVMSNHARFCKIKEKKRGKRGIFYRITLFRGKSNPVINNYTNFAKYIELYSIILIKYVTLDNFDDRKLARKDPAMFFRKYTPPLIIDEVQYAPKLFTYIKI